MSNQASPQPAGGLNLAPSDIYFILYRHKVKIFLFAVLGVVAAGAVMMFMPKSYVSEARLFIRYVKEARAPVAVDGDAGIRAPSFRGEGIIAAEIAILTSMDLAEEVARRVGPERIAPEPDIQNRLRAAASRVRGGLSVNNERGSSIVSISFESENPEIVKPVAQAIVDVYYDKHVEVHRAGGAIDNFLTQQTDQLRARLARTEEELQQARERAGITSLAETKAFHANQISRLKEAILNAEAELAAVQASLEMRSAAAEEEGEAKAEGPAATAAAEDVGRDLVEEYARLQTRLGLLRQREQNLLVQFTGDNALVKGVREQIDKAQARKRELEKEEPLLVSQVATRRDGSSGFSPAADLQTRAAQAAALKTRIQVLKTQLEQIRQDAARVAEVESEIEELLRRKERDQQNYQYFAANLEQSRIDEALGAGGVNNISVIQSPTEAMLTTSKTKQIAAGVAAGGLAVGLAWAFLVELYIDRSIKRPVDVRRVLGIPLFLAIPDIDSRKYRRLLRKADKRALRIASAARSQAGASRKERYQPKSPTLMAAAKADPETYGDKALALSGQSDGSPAPWEDTNALHPYYEALRDRVIGFFESRNLVHKPKLIGLTGLGDNPGVTTIAAGLAGCLSKTGEGNVLLVDMTLGQESAQQFYKGKAVQNLEEIIESGNLPPKTEEGFHVAAEGTNGFKLPRILPNRFNSLVPKLKASDFDYIIFDMPAVSPISVTPRLASYMDAMLMVVEAEKSDREQVEQATELLSRNNPNVGAILNKTRNYGPGRLKSEFVN